MLGCLRAIFSVSARALRGRAHIEGPGRFAGRCGEVVGNDRHREVDRRLVYIDPHPAPLVSPRRQQVPGFFATLRGALSDIPSSQPVTDELARVIEFNGQVRRLRAIIDSARPHVGELVTQVVTTTFDRAIAADDVRGWREQVEKSVRDSREALAGEAAVEADPINPQKIATELTPRLPDRAIVTADSGTTTVWWARNLDLREGMMGSVSGTLATMGCSVPYAIAAKFAHPDRPVIALVGDGAMQMNGMSELITISRYWRQWTDPRLIVMALNNRELAFVTWEERVQIGDPKWPASQTLPDIPYADIAKLMGLGGRRVERPEDIGPAWDEALAADRPFVLDILGDPNVAPLPPHITLDQARAYATAIWHEQRPAGMIAGTAKQILGRILPD